jgi:hypothetical protein
MKKLIDNLLKFGPIEFIVIFQYIYLKNYARECTYIVLKSCSGVYTALPAIFLNGPFEELISIDFWIIKSGEIRLQPVKIKREF